MPPLETGNGKQHSINVQKEVNQAERDWKDIEAHYAEYPDGPEKQRLLEIHSAAMQKLERAQLLQGSDLPDSFNESLQELEDAAELYKEANELRAALIGAKTRELSGAEANESTDAALILEADALEFPESLRSQLTPYIADLGVDPTQQFSGRLGYFQRNNKGGLSVDIGKLRKAERALDAMMPLAPKMEQRKYIENLIHMHQQLEQISPFDKAVADMNAKNPKMPPETLKGLRMAGVAVAAFYLVWSLAARNWKFSAVSGIALLLLLKPDILKNKSQKDLSESSFLAHPKTRRILEKNLRQPGSAAAVEEIYTRIDSGGDEKKGIQMLSKQKTVSNLQLDQYLGSEPGALKDLLLNIDPAERSTVVDLLSRAKSSGAREIVTSIIGTEFEQVQKPEDLTPPEPS